MKILHIMLSKRFAGSEKYLIDLINFQSHNHTCYLIKNKNNKSHEIYKNLDKKIKVFEINNFIKFFSVNWIINKIRPNIVHTHLGQAGRSIIKRIFFKLIATVHMNYIEKYYSKHDALIVSNETQKNEILKKTDKKIKKIYLWGKTNVINTPIETNLRDQLGIPKHAFVFGSVGRFHYQKGYDLILDAFKKINNSEVYLILIGHDYQDFLSHKKENIFILPHQYNPKNYYKIFDCFIMASRWETFGMTLVEAMEMELPIITSIHQGNLDWIKEYNIDTFDFNKVDELYLKMKKKLNEGKRKEKYNLEKFNYEKRCCEITEFYNEI